jgi:chemotaxis protein methyltransferase CheR
LQELLPELGYRWKGFRKVRKQVCKRIRTRLKELDLPDLASYHRYLDKYSEELSVLDSLCNITISRFYRDKQVFDRLSAEILPFLAENAARNQQRQVRCWSAGCCSGEEPYTLQIIWKLSVMPRIETVIPLMITATDRNVSLLERAKKGIYPAGALKDMPSDWRITAFEDQDNMLQIQESFKEEVEFSEQDIREDMPEGEFDIILCRNLVFTYFQENLQQDTFNRMMTKLIPGGFFIVGIHESVPGEQQTLVPQGKCIYRKRPLN